MPLARSPSARGLAVVLACVVVLGGASGGRAAEESRDRFRDDVAANAEVERVMRSFQGRGAVGDDSQPSPRSPSRSTSPGTPAAACGWCSTANTRFRRG